eukprot:TRINITY_DN36472_c0_g2_i1.p1 TRINITY_DN36472_c0_g2~~TRINITY_DN36472_c0_g2_i1.p1  ORF type:complete len:318 (+),score=62.76 TRINITY_DN36472_c0_g2_i1:65-955(+)
MEHDGRLRGSRSGTSWQRMCDFLFPLDEEFPTGAVAASLGCACTSVVSAVARKALSASASSNLMPTVSSSSSHRRMHEFLDPSDWQLQDSSGTHLPVLIEPSATGQHFPHHIGPWIVEERWEARDLDQLINQQTLSGSAGAAASSHDHHHSLLEHLGGDEFLMSLFSTGLTVFLASLSALSAIRLAREMVRSSAEDAYRQIYNAEGLVAGRAADLPAGMMAVDVPGVPPFTPFSGSAHRLSASKPSTPDSVSSGPPAMARPTPSLQAAGASSQAARDAGGEGDDDGFPAQVADLAD